MWHEGNRVDKAWDWYRFSASLLETMSLDYVVYTDAHVVILPTIFWEDNPLFYKPHPAAKKKVYGGISVSKADCRRDNKCPSLQGEYLMRRFVLLSPDLVHYLAQLPRDQRPELQTPKESHDVAIANALWQKKKPQVVLHNVTLQGLVPKTSSKGLVGIFCMCGTGTRML